MTECSCSLQAAIRVAKDHPVDEILTMIASTLSHEGRAVFGFLQGERDRSGACCAEIVLRDVQTDEQIVISQPLGAGSRGCRLDPQALAAVVGPMVSRLHNDPDLLILNRFGKGESEGHGFRAVIEEACARGIPVLTVVREDYVAAWEQFSGELGCLLQPDQAIVLDWARRAVIMARAFPGTVHGGFPSENA